MIDPIALGQTKEFILEADKETENPTIWILGALDSMQKSQLLTEQDTNEEANSVKATHKTLFTIVKYGLKGVKNFGNVEFETEKIKFMSEDIEVLTDSFLKKIPFFAIAELSSAIWQENEVSGDLEKN